MKNGWTQIGNMKNGEAVYVNEQKELAIEKDYSLLVQPTADECAEIYENMAHLCVVKG
jgi:hypothetical protein